MSSVQLSLLSSIACGDLIYDSCFHPCGDLFATTTRLHPIHLWDPQGQLMASYRGINHLVSCPLKEFSFV